MNATDDILLAIDQGTSSTRTIGFTAAGAVVAVEQQSFEQIYPNPGWVEHDPEVIWATVMSTSRRVLQRLTEAGRTTAAVGITNQRETTILWDRRSGVPIYNAIVWQDRRTAERCRELERDHGETEVTNASRTALYDIVKGRWDQALCEMFTVPMTVLPEVRDSAGEFGVIDKGVLGHSLPICAVAGDQQAALVGQACFAAGDVKSTYGTGAFLVLNTAQQLVPSKNRLLSTIAYQLAMAADGLRPATLKVDGGMAQNDLFMQRLADVLARPNRNSFRAEHEPH